MKIGDYVRTKRKGIIKIDEIIDNGIIIHEDAFGREWEEETNLKVIRYNDKNGWNKEINENDVLKSSPNIIDLIEVGDYVNGKLVSYIGSCCIEVYWYKDEMEWLEQEDIISIVTHEQFESMEYKL